MKKFVAFASVLSAVTWIGAASAEPVKMTDRQLTQVTAAGGFKITNIAIASNSVSTSGGSASAKCFVGCAAVNVPIGSGNIIDSIIYQSSSAKAGTK